MGVIVSYPAPRAWIEAACVCEEWSAELRIASEQVIMREEAL